MFNPYQGFGSSQDTGFHTRIGALEETVHAQAGKIADLEFKHKGMEQWHEELLKRVVVLEGAADKQAKKIKDIHTHLGVTLFEDMTLIKSQAAAAQATQHLYAPLRSDTKPLLEMSAFVRKVAMFEMEMKDVEAYAALARLVFEAAELVKRHT